VTGEEALGGPFRILYVCTGNICRSPMAERLTRHGLATRLGDEAARIVVESAGTWGHEGSPMEPHAAETVLTYRGDPRGFSARELLHRHVVAADVVLTAAREHREHVLALEPAAIRRVFTLKEFTRLAGAVDADRLPTGDIVARARALVGEAAVLRRRVRARWPADDDVADPYGAPMYVYRACAAEIANAVDTLLAMLVDNGGVRNSLPRPSRA
jgi:low molecular weight protein-tyrosine phosphatase